MALYYMKKLTTILLLAIFVQPVFAQTKLLPKFVRKMFFEKDTTKKGSFVILPVISSAPETGLEAGGSALYSFYTDTLSKNTRVSNIFAYATITTKGQSRLNLSSSYWSPQNNYHFTGAIGYINFPFDFYGVGNNTLKADADRLGQKRVRVNFTAEKRIGSNIYVGLVAGGLDFRFHDQESTGIFTTDPTIEGKHGGTTLYLGPSFVFDSRNNNTYTTKGTMLTSHFDFMHGVGGNNNLTGGFLNVEFTQFFALSKRFVLGFDIQSQNWTGNQSPFYLLPALGSDEMMRGYYNGRFRDRNLIAGQTELRYRMSERFGIVGFIGTGEVFNKEFSVNQLKPNYGGGLRYFFDIQKGLSIRVDYGVGEKRPGETRQSGVYVGLGEAF
ncbi:outer membrane protein assembly factor [Mucilaginibacter aquariorum]|uniref:Outer membrane protein assembly factor n=1 Tax=Mucilaginibacter aquariorum TaxID=2967225 RepID=A0ABT1T6B6_9SPHI|nr:outer membrane protein assembly factor [Mucilaginibacter aquariorum]MCQ6959781.1 outer membrane protein assembly factor [Mucilaginibacter aquariorum]